ncbi:MAG: hypothetical protein ABSD70_18625 [Terracidiphilus sp.]|jgi:hypothetical protein
MSGAVRGDFSGHKVALDPPKEGVAWIIFSEDLKMGVETVAIHFDVKAWPLTFGADLDLAAVDSCSDRKNCIVSDQFSSFLDL